MEIKTDLSAIVRIQELAKSEISKGDLVSAKILLVKAKEMLVELNSQMHTPGSVAS